MSWNEKNKSHRRGKLPSHPIESLSFKSCPEFSSLKLYFYNTSFSFIFINVLPLELKLGEIFFRNSGYIAASLSLD